VATNGECDHSLCGCPRWATYLLLLEATVRGARFCGIGATTVISTAPAPANRTSYPGTGDCLAPGASHLGQTPHCRRACQARQLARADQPEYGPSHPPGGWSLAVPTHAQKKPRLSVRTADIPGHTLQIDLCFVPAIHHATERLPAVSGSSGRLWVERAAPPAAERRCPGTIFTDPSLPYDEAMQRYARASHQRFHDRKHHEPAIEGTPDPRRALRAEAAALRMRRRSVRERRRQDDQAWRTLWNARKAVLDARRRAGGNLGPRDDADDRRWQVLRQQRHVTLVERMSEDNAWRTEHQALRQALATEALPTSWRAILLVTDNCTRQCYDLPLFARGGHVSAEDVVTGLEPRLPTTVQFVISDQGTHFMAKVFQHLAHRTGFVHVPTARHRPETNGIAERCVRTLKAWLLDKTWSSERELAELLASFRTQYNDRPHQGLGIPGLSPNEFARRIWLL